MKKAAIISLIIIVIILAVYFAYRNTAPTLTIESVDKVNKAIWFKVTRWGKILAYKQYGGEIMPSINTIEGVAFGNGYEMKIVGANDMMTITLLHNDKPYKTEVINFN